MPSGASSLWPAAPMLHLMIDHSQMDVFILLAGCLQAPATLMAARLTFFAGLLSVLLQGPPLVISLIVGIAELWSTWLLLASFEAQFWGRPSLRL